MNEAIRIYLHHIKTVCPELPEDQLLIFSEKLTVTMLDKNDVYIAAGHIQKQGGFLVNGLLRAFHTDDLGNEKNIYLIPEGEYAFHYASFMDNIPSPLTFQCLERSAIVNFTADHLQNMYNEIPEFQKYGRMIVEAKLKIQQQRLESFLFQNAEQRYVDFISQYPQLFNRISISQLCSYLGVERQTLTRIRNKLSKSTKI